MNIYDVNLHITLRLYINTFSHWPKPFLTLNCHDFINITGPKKQPGVGENLNSSFYLWVRTHLDNVHILL